MGKLSQDFDVGALNPLVAEFIGDPNLFDKLPHPYKWLLQETSACIGMILDDVYDLDPQVPFTFFASSETKLILFFGTPRLEDANEEGFKNIKSVQAFINDIRDIKTNGDRIFYLYQNKPTQENEPEEVPHDLVNPANELKQEEQILDDVPLISLDMRDMWPILFEILSHNNPENREEIEKKIGTCVAFYERLKTQSDNKLQMN